MNQTDQIVVASKKPRLAYIDIAKGILICCLLYGHIRVYGPMEDMWDNVMRVMSHTGGLYGAFFMQSFFIITGFCSSFKDKFIPFLWKNLKTLLIPAILLFLFSEYYKLLVFGDEGGAILPLEKLAGWVDLKAPWFVLAMFWGRIIYWWISRVTVKIQILVLFMLYILGLLCNMYEVHNYQFFQHTLLLLPYIFVGQLWKGHKDIVDAYLKPVAIFGACSILLQNILSQAGVFSMPEHDFAICVSIKNFPLHILNSITGTAFVIFISKRISNNRFLERMGLGTLLIYLWNDIVYRSIVRLLWPIYCPDNIVLCVVFHVIALALCYASLYFIIRPLYQGKYLKWIMGKY